MNKILAWLEEKRGIATEKQGEGESKEIVVINGKEV